MVLAGIGALWIRSTALDILEYPETWRNYEYLITQDDEIQVAEQLFWKAECPCYIPNFNYTDTIDLQDGYKLERWGATKV